MGGSGLLTRCDAKSPTITYAYIRGRGLGGVETTGGRGGGWRGSKGEGLSDGKCIYFSMECRRGLRAGYRRSSWSSSKACRDGRKE